MADLKRNLIELVTNPEEAAQGAEVETKKYWTPPFIPLSVVYQAVDLVEEIDNHGAGKVDISERALIEKLAEFTTETVYKNQFSRDDLKKGLHAPDAVRTLQEQIAFVARGQLSKATKEFRGRKN